MSEVKRQEQYEGTLVQVGNSQDIIAADAAQLRRIGNLVKGVKID